MTHERIGKYRIIAKLGQGGMARVLLTMAEGPHGFNKLLVVKELKDDLAHDPEFLTMFLDEARIAARLNHPNIVLTYEVGNEGARYWIAMEYLEGQPLNAVFRRLGRKNIPLEIHLRILADVLAGLEHAHKLADFDGSPLDIVHRDISPQNIFVTYEVQVKVVDFGIAKAAGASSTTKEGILKGKISYIAPEQARCEPVDRRSDLFAVGVMLWEAVAGRRLVQKEDEMSILARRMSGKDPRVRDAVPDVPAEIAAICDRAMAPSPDDRFQSAREFREVLERYLAQSDFRVGPKEVGQLVTDAFDDERVRIKAILE
ncbi:MAG TPA: serine/threonine-protein kinase, partial [Polyangiaceae bacterium]|nr:serine/threonine-protein kinase [Polyangiaceae bacterium]